VDVRGEDMRVDDETTEYAGADQVVEEIIVTGSYIRRDDFDLPSPIDIISASDIEEQGSVHLGDVIRNLTYNYGTATIENITSGTPQIADVSFANLRGLGGRATLNLMDGRRALTRDGNTNINDTYPQIVIDRIEVLRDGGSALYGTDAVAGVVNYIPYHTYDGVRLEAYGLTDDDLDYDDWQLSGIGGHEWSRTSLVAAVEYRDRSRLQQIDRKEFILDGWHTSGQGNPGSYLVPRRTANDLNTDGFITADEVGFGPPARLPDPGCQNPANTGSTDPSRAGNFLSGRRTPFGCSFDFGEFLDYMSEMWQVQTALFVGHDIGERVRLRGEVLYGVRDQNLRLSPSLPGGRFRELGPIAGEHPGNPYRAFVDRNGNGLVDEVLGDPLVNETLFAQDGNGNGIPDRDLNGDGIADPGAELDTSAEVLLAPSPFDSTAGIAFNEDVPVLGLRTVSKGPRGQPLRVQDDGSAPFGFETRSFRFSGGVDFDIAESDWTGNLWYTFVDGETKRNVIEDSFSAVITGVTPRLVNGELVGGLGPNGDQFWNPFSTAQLQCVNRVCGDVLTPEDAREFNTRELVSEIALEQHQTNASNAHVVDAVFTGTAMGLPAGPLGVAVGAQWLRHEEEINAARVREECDSWATEQCVPDIDGSRRTTSAFVELALPLLAHERFGTMDLQLAGRYTKEDVGFDSFDPKLAWRYEPRPFIALRGSWGTSFITPTLQQLDRPPTTSDQRMTDRTCEISGACVSLDTFRRETLQGNPDLGAEEATVWNLGLTLRFLDGDLSMAVDWVRIAFDERIDTFGAQDVIDIDAIRFQRFLDDKGCASTADPAACQAAARDEWIDPVNKATGKFETEAIARDASGVLSNVLTTPINSEWTDYRGLEFSFKYRFEGSQIPWIGGDYGFFAIGLDGSYIDEYDFKASPLTPIESAVGRRNAQTSLAPPLPRWRLNSRVSWLRGRHSLVILTHFVQHVEEDSIFFDFGLVSGNVPSVTSVDASYSLTWDGLTGEGTTTAFTLGVIDAFQSAGEPILALGNSETLLHDPRGRRFYARITQHF
jgi:iron complex outermembrane receptor protein